MGGERPLGWHVPPFRPARYCCCLTAELGPGRDLVVGYGRMIVNYPVSSIEIPFGRGHVRPSLKV